MNRRSLFAAVAGCLASPLAIAAMSKKPGVRLYGPDMTSSTRSNNMRIVNVFDQSVVGDYLSSADGERIIMSIVRRGGR